MPFVNPNNYDIREQIKNRIAPHSPVIQQWLTWITGKAHDGQVLPTQTRLQAMIKAWTLDKN